jgi:hypothetical protein
MVEVTLEICSRVIAHLIFWIIIVILVTPAVLFVAAWQRGPYWQNVRANYVKFFEFCDPTTFL